MPLSPRELMRGNIICYDGKPRMVKAVSELVMLEGDKTWIGASLMNGEPISHVWLEKFGFQQEASNVWGNGKLVISFYGNAFKFVDSPITYEYCHQLQILHFAITGQHLLIPKLPRFQRLSSKQ